MFIQALICVATMLLYAIPGYLMVKTKLTPGEHISTLAKLLLYVSQPCLTVHSIRKCGFTWQSFGRMGISFGLMLLLTVVSLLLLFLIVRRPSKESIQLRIFNIAGCIGNYGFIGVPLLNAMMPDHPEVIAYTAMASLAMNILMWTACSAIITRNMRYISLRKIFLNPVSLATLVALPLWMCGVTLPAQLDSMIALLAEMSTPLCMLILGMRLATMPLRDIFLRPALYGAVAIKQLLFPLFTFALLLLLPLDPVLEIAIYLLTCCPVASGVLNISELLGQGQDKAAGTVLLGTSLSVLTIPLMTLLL